MTVTAPPDSVSDAARRFLEGPHNLLVGEDRPTARDGRTFESVDPATGDTIAQVAHAGPEDVDAAVAAAAAAFEHGAAWRKAPAAERSRLLNRLADLVEEHGQELAEIESFDNGKPV